jgi:hypothetical protein
VEGGGVEFWTLRRIRGRNEGLIRGGLEVCEKRMGVERMVRAVR